MRTPKFPLLLPLLVTVAVLAGCAPAPIYPPNTGNSVPADVAAMPQRHIGTEVVWGGRIVAVRNFADHTAIEVLSRPLDDSQRPMVDSQSAGRFLALIPGFVEPLDYPQGGLATFHGIVTGARAMPVGQARVETATMEVIEAHVWSAAEMRAGHPDIHFGLGVGIGL